MMPVDLTAWLHSGPDSQILQRRNVHVFLGLLLLLDQAWKKDQIRKSKSKRKRNASCRKLLSVESQCDFQLQLQLQQTEELLPEQTSWLSVETAQHLLARTRRRGLTVSLLGKHAIAHFVAVGSGDCVDLLRNFNPPRNPAPLHNEQNLCHP